MFDSVNFERPRFVIENAGETVLPDAQFLERPSREWFEIIGWVAPLGGHYFIEF